MIIAHDLSELSSSELRSPIGFSIGNFDGLHLGHQALLSHLRQSLGESGTLCVYTFTNHPSTVLSPAASASICTLLHKLKLLKEFGVDLTIARPFSKEFAGTPYDTFLHELRHTLFFSSLVLGKGASFGLAKEGNEERIVALGQKEGFSAQYVEKRAINGQMISSGYIRTLIQQGRLDLIPSCLGRPYSVYNTLYVKEKGDKETMVLSLQGLTLLPKGRYRARLAVNTYSLDLTVRIDTAEKELILDNPVDPSWNGTVVEVLFHSKIP